MIGKKKNIILRFVCLFVVFCFRVHAFKIQLNQNGDLKNVTQCQSMTNTSCPVVTDFSGKSQRIGSNYVCGTTATDTVSLEFSLTLSFSILQHFVSNFVILFLKERDDRVLKLLKQNLPLLSCI